jgi:exosortase A-associated hydrolase 2
MQEQKIEAKFISGRRGALFSLHRAPQMVNAGSHCIVVAPSFAEEMNRCRYMCTMLAREITRHNCGYLAIDLHGTGDSAGDFSDADWDTWRHDLVTACNYAKELGYERITFLGIRLGALLAMEALQDVTCVHRIILWQPVISGKTALTQFMRIRIAASLERDENGGTIAEFERQLERGQHVQVAGYDVSPALYKAIQSARLDSSSDYQKVPIAWFNTLASEERKTPRMELDFLERWRDSGADISYSTVIGPSYWAVHERTLAPGLVDATVAHVLGACAA